MPVVAHIDNVRSLLGARDPVSLVLGEIFGSSIPMWAGTATRPRESAFAQWRCLPGYLIDWPLVGAMRWSR